MAANNGFPNQGLPSKELLGAVICGGRSSRMGRDKAMLQLPGGSSFLDHAVDLLAAVCETVCLFGEHRYAARVDVFPDSFGGGGPIAGVLTALSVARQRSLHGCLSIAVDTPSLTAEDLVKLIDLWQLSPTTPTCGRCAETQRIQPLIAIYPTQSILSLQHAADSGQRSLRRWLRSVDHRTVDLPARACRNFNTPDDLKNHFPTIPGKKP